MPAADYTQWLAKRIAKKDWGSIHALLVHLNDENTASKLIKTVQRYRPYDSLECKPALIHEMQAALLLCARIQMIGQPSNRRFLTTEVLSHILACHRFTIKPTEKFPQQINHVPGPLATALAKYPVTFRAALASGTMPHGDYLLRQYGLSSSINTASQLKCGVISNPRDKIIPEDFRQWLDELEISKAALKRLK